WIGRTVASMQLWDVLRAVQWALEDEKLTPESIALYGKSDMAILALYAGVLDDRIDRVVLCDPPTSHWQGPALLNVLRVTDIPEVASAFAPRELVVLCERSDQFPLAQKI